METYTYRGDAIGTTHTLGWTYEGTVCSAQDGVIQGDEMFNFDARGNCTVYSLSGLPKTAFFRKTASFRLDKADLLVPHSNAVSFGAEHFAPEDEFPLLYSNIYNNYAKEADRLEGVCLVYRLTRDGAVSAQSWYRSSASASRKICTCGNPCRTTEMYVLTATSSQTRTGTSCMPLSCGTETKPHGTSPSICRSLPRANTAKHGVCLWSR